MSQPKDIHAFNLVDAARWLDEMARQLPMFSTHGKRPDVDQALAEFVDACNAAHLKAKRLLALTGGRPDRTNLN